jgi:hypothetical protein
MSAHLLKIISKLSVATAYKKIATTYLTDSVHNRPTTFKPMSMKVCVEQILMKDNRHIKIDISQPLMGK